MSNPHADPAKSERFDNPLVAGCSIVFMAALLFAAISGISASPCFDYIDEK
jgi:hypothetical protein